MHIILLNKRHILKTVSEPRACAGFFHMFYIISFSEHLLKVMCYPYMLIKEIEAQ